MNATQYKGVIIDFSSLTCDDVYKDDYPKFCDAYFDTGQDILGNELDSKTLEWLGEAYPGLLNETATESLR
tara:strand:- start:6503 stop:6715 length:213 start_codon:yes stop_codon:yes gene_type:complete